ncbi:3-carboxyethylcatechol 2,3-dioxygenase [Rhodococcus sp. NPDC003322]
MTLALCCISHSPLLDLPGPPADLLKEVASATGLARQFVRHFDPELVVVFSPDHYNGFFHRLMPPFCIGTAARGVGDYGTYAGAFDVPEQLAAGLAQAVLDAGVDIAVSADMEVDHGTAQPLARLFDDVTAVPILPIFVNSVALPLGPLSRTRALGAAVGRHLESLGKRVLVVGSGGLSHDPPVPSRTTATGRVLDRIVHGTPMTSGQRLARQEAVIEAAREFASGGGQSRPLNPDWDRRFLEVVDEGRLDVLDSWSNAVISKEAGNSAHEIRTWVAAYSALAVAGPYRTDVRYYRPAPELIAGFAVRTAASEAAGVRTSTYSRSHS